MSRNRARGTAAETAVVNYLHACGWPHAERRALHGTCDRGDVTGVDPRLVIEIKDHAGTQQLGAWETEAAVEADNAHAEVWAVWSKKRGKGSPAEWRVTMPGSVFATLLRAWCK